MTTLSYITIGIVALLFIIALFWPDKKEEKRIPQKDNLKVHVKVNLNSLDDLSLQALRVLLKESLSTNQCETNKEAFERVKDHSFRRLEDHKHYKQAESIYQNKNQK